MSPLYAVVDTARDPMLYDLVHTALDPYCLFAGDLAPELRRTAPYLVPLDDAEQLLNAWRTEGRGQSWGIFLRSPQERARIRRHLRHFNLAQLPDGRRVLFRWWDPRVFRVYLPTCDAEDLKAWFAGIDEFACEAPARSAFDVFRDSGGMLLQTTVRKSIM
jgi:hypothetical protein